MVSKMVIKNPVTNQVYSLADKTLIIIPDTSNEIMVLYGVEQGKEIQLDVPFDKIKTVADNGGGTQTVTEEEVEPFLVYDYISETPEVLVYTEAIDDIAVSTTTEPLTLYDEFGDEVEVLYYTDDEAIKEADLILDANWSPIDELNGDFEVVTWTDEPQETAQRVLEMNAVPAPKFIYSLDNPTLVENVLQSVISKDLSITINTSNVRYLFTDNNTDWYTWNGIEFVKIANLTNATILADGITNNTLLEIGNNIRDKWTLPHLNVGLFLADDARDSVISKVDKVAVEYEQPLYSTEVSDAKLYILNTTAQIDVDFSGLTLSGTVSDADQTRVQYRVLLNGVPYYPSNGDFTKLGESPQNISITLKSSEIKIGDWNTLEVEFKDYFGTVDTWSVNFIGKYAGLMFMDENNEYYSTDMGAVLQYLDFGEILTGQITQSYPIKLKNEYGFDVKDAKLTVNTNSFAEGLVVEFETAQDEAPATELFIGNLANKEEFEFSIKMKSPITTIPNGNSTFDIYVFAKRDV